MHPIFVASAARGQDLGVVPEAVEQRLADLHPLAEGEVGRGDRRAPLAGEEVEDHSPVPKGTKPSSSTISSATRR